MAKLILILGGARSGKSRFAQQLAQRLGGQDVLFLATAEAGDAEMARRIEIHRHDRPKAWDTMEQPLDVGRTLADVSSRYKVVLIDCLTLMVSNVLLSRGDSPDAETAEQDLRVEMERLLDSCRQSAATVILVSGEVGLGLVPEYPVSRLYRDLLGRANQLAAAQSDATYLLVAGLPVDVKTLAVSLEQAATF